jgi:flavodoxin
MNVGIIIHSDTGKTLFVAEQIQKKLMEKGLNVNVERVTAVKQSPHSKKQIVLENVPDPGNYDAVILGAPVWNFSLSPVMKLFLKECGDKLKDKTKGCFITQGLAYRWMGANRAIKQFKKLCSEKGFTFETSAVVNWQNKSREKMIENAANVFAELF